MPSSLNKIKSLIVLNIIFHFPKDRDRDSFFSQKPGIIFIERKDVLFQSISWDKSGTFPIVINFSI